MFGLQANLFFSGASRAFFPAVGGLFVFVAFQPANGQARQGGAVNIRELALVDISAPPSRIGQSPEKLQIFLCYSLIPFCPIRELKPLAIVPFFNGRELLLSVFKSIGRSSFPLGKVGKGPLCWDGVCRWMVRTPGNSVGVAIS